MMPVKQRPEPQVHNEKTKILKKRAYCETNLVSDNNLRIKGPGDIRIVDPEDYLIIGPVAMESRNFYSYRRHEQDLKSENGEEGGARTGKSSCKMDRDGAQPIEMEAERGVFLDNDPQAKEKSKLLNREELFKKSDSLDRNHNERDRKKYKDGQKRDLDMFTPILMLPSLESMVANIPVEEYAKWYPRYRQTVLNSIWGFLNEIRKTYHINENIKNLANYSEWALRFYNMMESKDLSIQDFMINIEPLLRRVHNFIQTRIGEIKNENKVFFVKFRFQDNQPNEEFWNLKDDTFKNYLNRNADGSICHLFRLANNSMIQSPRHVRPPELELVEAVSLTSRKAKGKLIEEISKAKLPPEKNNLAIDRMIKWMLIYLLTLLGNVDLYLQLRFPHRYIPEGDAYRPLDMQNYDHNKEIIRKFLSFMNKKRGPTRLSAMKPNTRNTRTKKGVKKKIDRNHLNFRLLDGEAQHMEWRELMRFLRVRDLANMLRICHTPRRNKDRFSFSLNLLCLSKRSRNYQLLKREFGIPAKKVWICKDEIEGLFKFQLRKPDDYERIGKKTFQAYKKKITKKKGKGKCKESANFMKEVAARFSKDREEYDRKTSIRLDSKMGLLPEHATPDPHHPVANGTAQLRYDYPQRSPSLRATPRLEPNQDSNNDVFIDDSGTVSEHCMGRDMIYTNPNIIDFTKPMKRSINPNQPQNSFENQTPSQTHSQTQVHTVSVPPIEALTPGLTPYHTPHQMDSPYSISLKKKKQSLASLANPSSGLVPSKDQELLHFLKSKFIPFYVENNLTDKVLEKYCDNPDYIFNFLCMNKDPGDNRGPKGTYLFQYVILSQYYSLEKMLLDQASNNQKKEGKPAKREKKAAGRKKKRGSRA